MGPPSVERNAMSMLRCQASRGSVLASLIACMSVLAVSSTKSFAAAAASEAAVQATVIAIAGAPGEPEFAPDLALQLTAWAKVSEQARAKHVAIGGETAESGTDLERV